MVFSSATFLFAFLPAVLLLVLVFPARFRNVILLLCSLFFYAWGEQVLVGLMMFSIAINYGFARLIDQSKTKFWLYTGVGLNLGMLVVFKYTDFLIENFNELFKSDVELTNISLPIGISFFTFQGLSYLIDVHRKVVTSQKSLIKFGTYISFFPQLIAGPIVRYQTVAKDLSKVHFSRAQTARGFEIFAYGLIKKLLFANTAGKIADEVFNLPDPATPMAWAGAICYALQIYYDFSGYSDMAIGLGKAFGFRFPVNFKHPYAARSMQDFWRRWHITLSTWFRDYLYIPLGGNRQGPVKTYFNLLVVFFFTGLWHGASWNFVIWGLWHGLFLLIERMLRGRGFGPKIFGHFYTFMVVVLGWVFFRAETFGGALDIFESMFFLKDGYNYTALRLFSTYQSIILVLAAIFCMPARYVLFKWAIRRIPGNLFILLRLGLLALILFFSMLELASSTFNPFIYFRF